ncbi:tyrosine-protein phosphatase [Heyndrickxia acidicola]|uniref:Tyrosine-protein phosphatase n=1 Tax=Heyndrickxia acidicola TaxID=209389 RepID=A0ABU6MNC1_9BACI|nr:CpsB/CapC family capsule biosynthesis tyrosine phosphatase [Heyndrickxia acidicola]MED1204707.1 tyrosine protein phosphatase [Heyndrickxia acidicola]
MIDLHCHILPGVDDGAQNLADSLEMAKQAVSQGIHTIVATPHHMNGQFENRKTSIQEKVTALNSYLRANNIHLTVLPGQENRIFGEILEDYENDEILTVADHSSYILIEFPSGHVPRYAKPLLYDIQRKGLTPVIVHPERNAEFIENPNQLYEFVKNGAATQITAASVTGSFGKKIKRFTEQLIEANLTHFIASDAHNVHTRSFKMDDALDVVESKFGTDMVYYLTENAQLVLKNQHIYREVPEPIKTKRFLGIF